MRITILGCGGSGGVPVVGNYWGNCNPSNPKNRRLRTSILVEDGDTTLLVDTTPDMRQQLLNAGVTHLDAVLYTHSHADHVHGIDDLRPLNRVMRRDIDIHATAEILEAINRNFSYVLGPLDARAKGFYYKPCVRPRLVEGPFSVAGIDIVPFPQDHGFDMTTIGYRFANAAYSTDVVELSEAAFDILAGVDLWIVDCLRLAPHVTHTHLEKTLKWIDRVGPRRAVLTHMDQTLDYDDLMSRLPPGVEAAYDGLVLEID